MKREKISVKAISWILAVLMAVSVLPMSVFAAGAVDPSGLPKDTYLISQTQYKLAPGVDETQIVMNNAEGSRQNMGFAVTVEMGGSATILASYKNQDGSSYGLQSVRDQAAAAEKKRGANVVAGVNGMIFNMQTGAPTGLLIMDGIQYSPDAGYPYFAILKNGQAVIRDPGVPTDDVKDGIGLWQICARDGVNLLPPGDGYMEDGNPRTAIGIKADGSVVMMVTDGRQAPKACGMSWSEVIDILLGMGCVIAGHLDGGGSTTYISKHEGETALACRNSPSDGNERSVSTALLVSSSAKPTGVFDHASLSPNNEVYTPYSEVQFTANGVDSSGASVALPEDGKFALADDSFGTITDDGLFVSSGKTGSVVVNYVSGGAVTGSVSIEIVIPDAFHIASAEVSLGFEETTDFHIEAKYQNRTVHMKAGDIVWNITDDNGADLNGVAGTFDGLTFTTVDGITVNANVTATLKYDESVVGHVRAIIGAMPTVLYDFEYTTDQAEAESNPELKYIPSYVMPKYDHAAYGSSGAQAAVEYENGYPFLTWPNGALGFNPQYMTAEVVSKDDNEPVRFGNKSMKITFDFSGFNNSSNGNCYLRTTVPDHYFEGSPTAFGAWIYIPEGITSALQIYLQVANKLYNTSYGSVGATAPSDNPKSGPSWTGWKYVELDLTNPTAGSNLGPDNAPFGTYQGNGILWISYQPGNFGALKAASSIYVDNFQLVYGANTDDIENPFVKTIEANYHEIDDGKTVLTSNVNTFKASYADFDGKYATGINFDEVKMLIDGVDVTDRCFINKGDEEIYFYDAELADGIHNLTVSVADMFGNTGEMTKSFVIDGGNEKTTATMVEANGSPVLGMDYALNITSNNPADVTAADVSVAIASNFIKYWNNYSVVPAANYTLVGEPSYNTVNDSINFKVERKADADPAADDGVIAQLVIHIPTNVPEGLEVVYKVAKGGLEYASERSDKFVGGFTASVTTKCESPFSVAVDTMVVGTAGANINVYGSDGAPVEGVNVYTDTSELIGVTDAEGKVFTDRYIGAVQEFSIYAEKDGLLSFIYKGQSYPAAGDETGAPTFVKLNAVKDPTSSQSVSWMSSPLASKDAAVVLYAEKAAYEANGDAALMTFVGDSIVSEMSSSGSFTSNYAVRINNAVITDLKANTEYVYKVGDGEIMSELKSFSTTKKGSAVNFFVIGDTQATDTTNTDKITENLDASGVKYDFGIQTGDAVDNGGNYTMWANIAKVFSGEFLANQDLIQVLGNHEYYGDDNAHNASAYFNLPDTAEDGTAPLCYSVQYGNVYVAVVNYAGTSAYREAAKWVVEDAAKSTATWKVLSMHQPAYFTNPGGNSPELQEIVADMVDDANIDFVFSGHDHSYARTQPITAGEVDPENGAVYFICGSTGEKSYPIVDNEAHHYALLSENFNATYLTVSATDTTFDITVHDYTETGEDIILDSYSKTKDVTCTEEGEHDWKYDGEGLVCSVCGYSKEIGTFTGFVADAATGKNVYFYLGQIVKNAWRTVGEDIYYLDENGFAVTGKYTVTESLVNGRPIDGVENNDVIYGGKEVSLEYTFDDDGKLIRGAVVKANNTKYYVYAGVIQFGWHNIDGDLYYFDGVRNKTTYGKILTGLWTRNYTRFECDKDGKLVKGFVYMDEGGTKYRMGNDYVTGWYDIDGYTWGNEKGQNYKRVRGRFYFDPESGYMVTENTEIDGVMHYFNEDGTSVNGLLKLDDGMVYCVDGVAASGWQTIDGKKYYFDPANNNYAIVGASTEIDGVKYYFDEDGTVENGLVKLDDGMVFCADGASVPGWQTIDGEKYYFDPANNNYAVVGASIEIEGVVYSFNDKGEFVHNGAHEDIDGDGSCDECDLNVYNYIAVILAKFFDIIDTFIRIVELVGNVM